MRHSGSRPGSPAGSASGLSREILPYDADPWTALREDWQRLAQRAGIGSAFTSVPWVETWLDVFGDRMRPTGLRWRAADGETVACALLPTEVVRLGPFSIRRTYVNASGTPEAFCEHNDVLVEQEHRGPVLEDLVRIVLDSGADELALAGFREHTAADIEALWPGRPWSGYTSESPFVALSALRDERADYLSRLSRNTRSQIRRSRKLYTEQLGEPDVERAASKAQALRWFGELVELHQALWERRGEPGAFSSTARRFHESLIERCHEDPAADMRTAVLRVRFGETTVGILYFLEHLGRANFYQSGLVYHDDGRLKPGLVTHSLAVQHYLDAAFAEYDFLGGEPEAARYKRSLATDRRLLAWQELPVPGFRVNMIGRLRRARRRLRS